LPSPEENWGNFLKDNCPEVTKKDFQKTIDWKPFMEKMERKL